MKTIVTVLAIFLATLTSAQSTDQETSSKLEDVKLRNFSVSITVDSAEEIDATFKIEDIEAILENVETNEEISLEIICNGDMMSNGKRASSSYKVTGNTNNVDAFLKLVAKVRKGAIAFYNNK